MEEIASTSAVIKWQKMLMPLVFPYMTRFLQFFVDLGKQERGEMATAAK